MDALQKQVDDLKAQGKDDFKFLMIAFGTMGDRMTEVGQRMEELAQDMRIGKGNIAHQEERFEIILDVVQKMVDNVRENGASKADVWALERKVERLEQERPPAA